MKTQTANGANKRLVLNMRLRCVSLSFTTPLSLLVNEFYLRSVLHRQVSLAAVNQIYDFNETINEDSLKAFFENVKKIATSTTAM